MSMSMPRSLKVQGHKLVITEKIESLSHRSPASYCAVCECGFRVQVWADRLSVVKHKHNAHLVAVIQAAKSTKE
jgi:hypothetical protein